VRRPRPRLRGASKKVSPRRQAVARLQRCVPHLQNDERPVHALKRAVLEARLDNVVPNSGIGTNLCHGFLSGGSGGGCVMRELVVLELLDTLQATAKPMGARDKFCPLRERNCVLLSKLPAAQPGLPAMKITPRRSASPHARRL
jgi:hypothetical protein